MKSNVSTGDGVRHGYLQPNPEPPPRGLPSDIREIEACVICHRPFTPHNPRLTFPNCTHHICKVCSTEMEGKRGIVNCPYRCIGGVPLTEMIEYPEVGNVHCDTCELHPNQVLQTVCMTHLALMCFNCPEHQSKGCVSLALDVDRDIIRDNLMEEANSLKRRAQCLPTPLAKIFANLTHESIPQLCVLVAALRTPPDTFRCHHCPLEAVGLLVETLIPYCQRCWEKKRSQVPEASLLTHANPRDLAVIGVLQAEMKKYLSGCNFSAVSKVHFEAVRPSTETSIAEMLTLVQEVKHLSGNRTAGPHPEGIVCPCCRKTMSETGSGPFWQLPCRNVIHALCDICYQQSPFLTCPMDDNSYGKSLVTNRVNPGSEQLCLSRKVFTPHFRPILNSRYCVTLFSQLSAEGWTVSVRKELTLLEFHSSAAVKLIGVAIGRPTQPGQCVSIDQFRLYEDGFSVATRQVNPQEIRSAESPINEVYFGQYMQIHPNLQYALRVEFRGGDAVALYRGLREQEEVIEGGGGVRWTFQKSQERGPVVRLIYETTTRT